MDKFWILIEIDALIKSIKFSKNSNGGIKTKINLKEIGLPLAIVIFVVVMLIPLPGLGYSGHAAIALLIFAIIMWATEALHLAVTSLILLFLQPILGIENFNNAVIGFANPIIFLMIGGFILAEAIRKSGLAERLTYYLLSKLGTSPSMSLFAAVFSTGLLSAWIENVVAFAMLLPIIKQIIPLMGVEEPENGNSNFAKGHGVRCFIWFSCGWIWNRNRNCSQPDGCSLHPLTLC